MRLTAELIQKAAQYLNAINEFHCDLRGYKITVLENITATNDQFGTIDFTDNEVTKVPQFPKLRRLRTLLFSNNRITKIENGFGDNISQLESLVLTNNKISNFSEIDHIATCKTLLRLALIENPISKDKNYRLYTIFKIPSLRVLDFQKIKQKERIEARKMFATGVDSEMFNKEVEEIEPASKRAKVEEEASAQSIEERERVMKIKAAIEKAKTIEEVSRLENILKSGDFDKFKEESGHESNTAH